MLQPDSTATSSMLEAGKARLLVTWGEKRNPHWPDVPTLKESGLDIVSIAPFGLVGPKNMKPAVVKILHDAFKKALDEPSYRLISERNGQEPFYRDSAAFRQWAVESSEKEGKLLRALGLAKVP